MSRPQQMHYLKLLAITSTSQVGMVSETKKGALATRLDFQSHLRFKIDSGRPTDTLQKDAPLIWP